MTYDYVSAAAMFGFGFSWTIAIWFFRKNIGQIVRFIRAI